MHLLQLWIRHHCLNGRSQREAALAHAPKGRLAALVLVVEEGRPRSLKGLHGVFFRNPELVHLLAQQVVDIATKDLRVEVLQPWPVGEIPGQEEPRVRLEPCLL